MSSETLRVLVIDDSEDYIELCHDFLQRYRYLTNCDFGHPCWECELQDNCSLKHAHNWDEAQAILTRHGNRVDVVLLDLHFELPLKQLIPSEKVRQAANDPKALKRLKSRQGIHIMEALRESYGSVPVVLMTDKSHIAGDETVLAKIREHRFTEMFGEEGVNAQSLAGRIESLGRQRRQQETGGRFFWGKSPGMLALRGWLEVMAEGDQPILILGETGTGKSFLAEHFVHAVSRPKGPYCALDLSAIPENLVAAELFGTSRGAFSDAVDRAGRFEFASGGTLFLDEIGNLSIDAQKRLLTVIQDRRVTRLGENRSRSVDVKLVVATNENLEDRVRAGSFRADLYQRLNPAAKVEIPPLRERMTDLPELLQVVTNNIFESPGNRKLLGRFAALFNLPADQNAQVVVGKRGRKRPRQVVFQLAGAAEKSVRSAVWPGNVRQLELVWTNAITYQLVEQIAAGRVGDAPIIPIDAQLIQELIRGSSLGPDSGGGGVSEVERVVVDIDPAKTLNELSRMVEVQFYRELYFRSGESFERMASRMMVGDAAANARRVQLRFNNLGLSTRKLRKRS